MPVKVISFFNSLFEPIICIPNTISDGLLGAILSFVWLNTLYLLVTLSNPISNKGVLSSSVLSDSDTIFSSGISDWIVSAYTLNTFLYKLGLTVTFLSTVLVLPQRSVAV